MALLDIRRRSGYLFLAVMLFHVILISAQVNSRSCVPVLESVTFGVFAEAQRGLSTAVSGLRRMWGRYLCLRGVAAEDANMRRQSEAVDVEYQERSAQADCGRSFEDLRALRDRSKLETVAAEMIAASASPDFRTLEIDKGTNEGLKCDIAVIASEGVVGRIVVPSS